MGQLQRLMKLKDLLEIEAHLPVKQVRCSPCQLHRGTRQHQRRRPYRQEHLRGAQVTHTT